MNKFFMIMMVLLIEILVILVLLPSDWIENSAAAESEMIGLTMGIDEQNRVVSQANRWYQSAVLDTDLLENIRFVMVPTQEQAENSRGMEKMAAPWFIYISSRIDTLGNTIYHILLRFAVLMSWIPPLIIFLLPMLYEGWAIRRIGQYGYDYTSPIKFRYSARASVFIGMIFIASMITPISIPPLIYPVLLVVLVLLMGVMASNMQKRI